jgi:hypothetical protein
MDDELLVIGEFDPQLTNALVILPARSDFAKGTRDSG